MRTPELTSLTTQLLNADRHLGTDTNVAPLIHQSVNYQARDGAHLSEMAAVMGDRYYARRGNPTSSQLAKVIADVEGAEDGLITASGMGALTVAMLAMLRAGDHVIGQVNHYIGISENLDHLLPSLGVETTRVDQRKSEEFLQAIRPNTKLIVLETPVNPLMHVTDLKAVCAIAKAHGIPTLCDSTFATPVNQRPISCGVDLVMHSATKYIGGHHDLLLGALVGRRSLIEKVWNLNLTVGAIAAPFNSWLALRGIRTLELRMRQHNANAQALAECLHEHPGVKQVFYPGLKDHPQHALAASQMTGFGGLLTFDLGSREAAEKFIKRLRLPFLASSLGGVASTLIRPASLFGEQLSPEALEKQGITPGLIRFATGIENTADLVADVAQALK